MYSKSFLCEITVCPAFHKDEYSGYIQEKFNQWITECFRTYTASFKVDVIQHGQKCYMYDSERDRKDIIYRKLWQMQYGTYTIRLSGEGIVMNGAKPTEPPVSIAEAMEDKLTLKYKESNDLGAPVIIAYGKGIGLPVRYSKDITGSEEWNNGFCESDIYCPNFMLEAVGLQDENFTKACHQIKKLMSLNFGENANIDYDPNYPYIKVAASYHLLNKNKVRFLDVINKLSCLAIEENGVQLTCSMDFISDADNFSLESYIFNEAYGRFEVKSINV